MGWQGSQWHPDDASSAPPPPDSELCQVCFPHGWPASTSSVGCGHGSWTRDVPVEDDSDVEDGNMPRQCKDPGCPNDAAKNRRWCNTHANPANRTA